MLDHTVGTPAVDHPAVTRTHTHPMYITPSHLLILHMLPKLPGYNSMIATIYCRDSGFMLKIFEYYVHHF